jgi:hypothetical protein
MKHKDFTGIVPTQYTGEEIVADSSLELKDNSEAKAFYEIAKRHLLNVNDWHKVAGSLSAIFKVLDPSGKEVNRSVEKGDYFKIDIPGPGSKEGDGYDWVLVEELKEISNEDGQSIAFRVRPCSNPFSEKKETAHFYGEESTSNFIVSREKNVVTATIIDRNIKPNKDAEKITDKIRDTVIGMGAIGLFSKLQWQQLADGLLAKE